MRTRQKSTHFRKQTHLALLLPSSHMPSILWLRSSSRRPRPTAPCASLTRVTSPTVAPVRSYRFLILTRRQGAARFTSRSDSCVCLSFRSSKRVRDWLRRHTSLHRLRSRGRRGCENDWLLRLKREICLSACVRVELDREKLTGVPE